VRYKVQAHAIRAQGPCRSGAREGQPTCICDLRQSPQAPVQWPVPAIGQGGVRGIVDPPSGGSKGGRGGRETGGGRGEKRGEKRGKKRRNGNFRACGAVRVAMAIHIL
jgi:hypothetical protein